MRKLLIISLLSLCSAGVFAAGPFEFGVRAGLNATDFKFSRKDLNSSYAAWSDARTGYHAGAWMRLGLGGIFVQPEFLYNWNNYDMNLRGDGAATTTSKIKVETLEVPVLVGYRLLFFRFNAGPVFNVMNKTSHSGGVVQHADVMKPTVSYSAGAGLDIMKVSLDVRYNGLFEKAKQTVEVAGVSQRLDTNFRGWTFGLGWKF